ncbi:PcfB family protein [Bifidobacterium callimiconis]|uniref:Mobilization protein n=1 Tax=Bifidobacterium callimiconis TaxID=2306973 RepID=A0A430FET9_9BIFI|nr:PcfB family protein [Bifidobacterium callimiconis]RSX51278.1 mobilization protein [Bifidobacterium callimiconis]
MGIEENVEGTAKDTLLRAGQGTGKLILKAGAKLAAALIGAGWRVTTAPIRNAIAEHNIGGEISEKQLQATGEDIHQISLDNESLKAVGKSLRQSGITYAIEKGNDGQYFLHFQGKDADHVEHAVRRAFDKLGLELDLDKPGETTPELEEPTFGTLDADDTPTGELPAISADDTPTGEIPTVTPEPRIPTPEQREEIATRAADAARPLMPTGPATDDAMTTISIEKPAEWDPNAELLADSLDKLGIPYIENHQGDTTTFTMPSDCVDAAMQCSAAIDPAIKQVLAQEQTETPDRSNPDAPTAKETPAASQTEPAPTPGQPAAPQPTDTAAAPQQPAAAQPTEGTPAPDITTATEQAPAQENLPPDLPFPEQTTAGQPTDMGTPQTDTPEWVPPDLHFPEQTPAFDPFAAAAQQVDLSKRVPDEIPQQSAPTPQAGRQTTPDGTKPQASTPAKERRDTGKGKPERGRKAKKTKKDFLDALKQKEGKIRGQQGRRSHQRTRGARPRSDKR